MKPSEKIDESFKFKKIKKIKWKTNETKKLQKLINENGFQWNKISKQMKSRTPNQCMQKYYHFIQHNKKGRWNTIEDQILLNWVSKNTELKNWNDCANLIEGRSNRQCKERWFNYLNPNLNKSKWEENDQIVLFNCILKNGFCWVKISKQFQNRSENQIKNYFYCSLRMLKLSKFKQIIQTLFKSNFNLRKSSRSPRT